jgi:hypothetical protein
MADLMLRGPGWTWQENDVLCDLFARFSVRLKDAVGFDAGDAVACSEAATALLPQQLRAHMETANERIDDVLAWAEAVFDDKWKTGVDPASWTLERLGRKARAGRMSGCHEPDLRIRRSSAARRSS